MEKSMATDAVNAVVGVYRENSAFFKALFLAKPRRRKERQQKVSLCASAAWRETVFRFSVVSVDGVWQEESIHGWPSAERAGKFPLSLHIIPNLWNAVQLR
jgi:hypothetical protein